MRAAPVALGMWVMWAVWVLGAGPGGCAEPGWKVLYLGDSLSLGPFGEHLDRHLRTESSVVHTSAVWHGSPYFWLERFAPVTASPGYWEKTVGKEQREEFATSIPKVENLLLSVRPRVVVVQAGTHLYPALRSDAPDSAAQVESVLDEFCRTIYQARAWIYWIEPPQAHPKRVPLPLQMEMTRIIREVVGRYHGRVYASGDVTEWSLPYPEVSDGIHYGRVEARQWAEAVAADFRAFSEAIKSKEAPPVLAVSTKEAKPEEGSEWAKKGRPEPLRARVIGPAPGGEVGEELQVKLILRKKSAVAEPGKIKGGNAFGVFEYEVVKVYQGRYGEERLRVAHMVVLNGRETAPNLFAEGGEYYLTLVRMDQYPALGNIPVISDLDPGEGLPVFICKF